MADIDSEIAEFEARGQPARPEPAPAATPKVDQFATAGIVKALSPPKIKAPKTIDDDVAEYEFRLQTGRPPTERVPLKDDAARAKEQLLAKAPKSVDDEILEYEMTRVAMPLAPKADVPHLASTDAGFTGYAKTALQVLGIDENLIIAGARKALGKKPHKDLFDNTWTNVLLEDFGMQDSGMTRTLGLAMSIGLSPSTYLSLGKTGAAKAGAMTLSQRGLKAAGEIAEARTKQTLAELAAKEAVKKNIPIEQVVLAPEKVSSIARQNFETVQQEIAKKFGEIHKANKGLAVGDDVGKLGASTIDRGGVKFEVPFTGHQIAAIDNLGVTLFGKVILPGEKVLEATNKAGLPDLLNAVSKISESKVAQGVVDPISTSYKAVKELGKNIFVKNNAVDKQMLDLWEDTQISYRQLGKRIEDYTEKRFARFGVTKPEQKKDFFDSITEAFNKPELVGKVQSKAGDPSVQGALDRFLGQGKWEGKGALSDRMAKLQKLSEGAEVPNWFPGISQRHAGRIMDAHVPALGSEERAFNRPRNGNPVEYVQDPIKALTLRRMQASLANIHDQMFEAVKKNKLGDPRKFSSLEEAAAEGYVPLTRPAADVFRKNLLDLKVDQKAFDPKEIYFVKKEFADQYKQLVSDQYANMGPWATLYRIFEKPTQVFKQHVTAPFPSFHFRNFTSNIVLNSYSIGGHAVDPNKYRHAYNILRGSNPETIFKTDIGERLSYGSILKEAEEHGVVGKGTFFGDLAGDALQGESKAVWQGNLSKLNPLSQEFLPSAFGRKVGNAVEEQARLVNYLTWRQKGLSPKLAAKEATEALFDYGDLTQAEQWMKLAIPFYTFSRKNLEAHFKLLKAHPGAIAAPIKAMRDLGPTEDEWNGIPEHMKNKLVAKFYGNFVAGFGLPIEDIVGLVGNFDDSASRLSPYLRYPLERIADKDMLSNRPIHHMNAAKEFTFVLDTLDNKNVPDAVKAPLKEVQKFLELKRDEKKPWKVIADPDKMHILRSSFTSRYQSMVGMLSDEEKKGWEATARLLMGLVRVEPDEMLQTQNKKRIATEEVVRKLNKHNVSKNIPIYISVGGNASMNRQSQKILDRLKDAKHPVQIDAAKDMTDTLVETEQQRNQY